VVEASPQVAPAPSVLVAALGLVPVVEASPQAAPAPSVLVAALGLAPVVEASPQAALALSAAFVVRPVAAPWLAPKLAPVVDAWPQAASALSVALFAALEVGSADLFSGVNVVATAFPSVAQAALAVASVPKSRLVGVPPLLLLLLLVLQCSSLLNVQS